ncbi:MAG: hypothetical protein ACYDA4_04670 [Ignavibacteriaceae bacterium]
MKKRSIRSKIEFTDDSDRRWDSIFDILEEALRLKETKHSSAGHEDKYLEKSTSCIESATEDRLA